MRMTAEQRIAAARSRVWEALNDPEILRQCIPGCQSLAREAADRLRAVVEIKIGPIGARFNAVVALADVDAVICCRLSHRVGFGARSRGACWIPDWTRAERCWRGLDGPCDRTADRDRCGSGL